MLLYTCLLSVNLPFFLFLLSLIPLILSNSLLIHITHVLLSLIIAVFTQVVRS